MRSLADSPSLVAACRVHRDGPVHRNTEVYAPCCGRRVICCAVVDVRHVPGTFVRGGGIDPTIDQDWLCDACRARLFADKASGWKPSTLLVLCDVPAVAIRAMRIRERMDEIAAADAAASRPHDPAAAFSQAVLEIDRVL